MLAILIITAVILVVVLTSRHSPEFITTDQLAILLDDGDIERARIYNDQVQIRIRADRRAAHGLNPELANQNYDFFTYSRDGSVAVNIFQRHNENIIEFYRSFYAGNHHALSNYFYEQYRLVLAAGVPQEHENREAEISRQAREATNRRMHNWVTDVSQNGHWFVSGILHHANQEFYNDERIIVVAGDRVAVLEGTPLWTAVSNQNVPRGWVTFTLNNRNSTSFWSWVPTILIILALIIMGIFFVRMIANQNKQTMGFSKTKATQQINSKVRFTDVAGAEEEKVELAEIVDFLKAPTKFKNVGARIPRGVLLVGPPGTGKTLFAKAVAGEANVPFFSISGSDFVEMFVGVGASRVRDLFEQAKRSQPCIIFIDEIDAVGRQRGAGLGGGHDEREQTLNQLLVQMDGFETNDGIIVMAATNRADILDPALLRPGRFDRQIYVNVPDVRGREAIFKVHARNKPLDPSIDFKSLARITSGFSGADIANILNEAAILCARDNRTVINMNDITEGINKATLGPQKKSRVVTEFDKRVTAYHEAGHAIVAKTCKTGTTVHEVSIIPRGGGAGGFTRPRPDNDDQMDTLSSFKAHIAMVMGGRAAEAIVIEDITTGASMDIKMATNTARRMVTEWGMSGNTKLGQVNYGGGQEVFLGKSYSADPSHSQETASIIDKEISRLVEEGYQKALDILKKYRAQLDVMARVLMECETIFTDEIDMIMEGKSAQEVKEAIDAKYAKKQEQVNAALAAQNAFGASVDGQQQQQGASQNEFGFETTRSNDEQN